MVGAKATCDRSHQLRLRATVSTFTGNMAPNVKAVVDVDERLLGPNQGNE